MSNQLPPFAIVSLSRCGSTALFRVLSLDTGVLIEYEPDFGDAWEQGESLRSYCRDLFSRTHGIKHVWDPNGWPFTNRSHKSTLECLARSSEWVEVNASVLECVDKVVFLRRRNQLARTLSDLLGQQTDLWGHSPDEPHSGLEVAEYAEQLRLRSLDRLDERLIEWYVRNASPWEDRIMSEVPGDRKLTVYYEDLFGSDVDLGARLACASRIGEWLGIGIQKEDERVRAIMQPGSKINETSSYARIPNFREIVSRFGEV
jgi:hypothetical protein